MSSPKSETFASDLRADLLRLHEFELTALYSTLEIRARVKNWAITVWVAVIVAVVTRGAQILWWQAALLMSLTPAMFWIMELMYGVITLIHENKIIQIEELLSKDRIETPPKVYPLFGYNAALAKTIPLRTKLKRYLLPAIKMETILFPYVIMVVASAVITAILFRI